MTLPAFTTPPTQTGIYWFKQKNSPYEITVEVRRSQKNGPLTVHLSNMDVPVAELAGMWRGPLKPFEG